MGSSFEALKNAFESKKENAVVEKDSDVLTMRFMDAAYSITSKKEETINFQTIGLDFMADPAGNFYLVEEVDGDILTHEITDEYLKGQLSTHLQWRSEVIENLGF